MEAVKKVLEDVRYYSGFPHSPAPGAVVNFLGNVAACMPTQDLRLTINLAELVIATAVYGPRHSEFRHSIWRFPSDATRSAFHGAMSAVAQAVALPPPDVLYAAGPPPQSQMSMGMPPHPVGAMPPMGVNMGFNMGPMGMNVPMVQPVYPHHSPRPPLSPHPHSPVHLSPRAAYIPNPILSNSNKQIPVHHHQPGYDAIHRKPPTPPKEQYHASPKQKRVLTQQPQQSGNVASPQGSRTNSKRSSPRSGSSPQHPSSPKLQSPKHPSSAKSSPQQPTAPRPPSSSPQQQPTKGRSPRISPSSSRRSSSPRGAVHTTTSHSGKDSSSSTSSGSRNGTRRGSRGESGIGNVGIASTVAPLTRNIAPDANTVPMTGPRIDSNTKLQSRGSYGGVGGIGSGSFMNTMDPNEDGMDGRKFSMITNESTSPPEDGSRGDAADSSGDLRAVASAARHVVESDLMQSMRTLEEEHRMERERDHDREDRSAREDTSPRFEDTSEERDHGSKRSSEEFYTPNELSPPPTSDVIPAAKPAVRKSIAGPSAMAAAPSPSQSSDIASPAMSQIYMDSDTRKYYKETKVDETVRQSVTTSITEHPRGPQSQQRERPKANVVRDSIHESSKNFAPRLFSSDSVTSSIDMKEASYMLSPSGSDAPSPSNQWQISHERGMGYDILSPLPMYSPPAMPPSQSRLSMATQMTPPVSDSPKPPLFRHGTYSPQLSVSSAGGQSLTDSLDLPMGSIVAPPPIQPKRLSDSSLKGCSQAQAQSRGSISSTQSLGGLPPKPPKAPLSSLQRRRSQGVSPTPSQVQLEGSKGKTRVSFAPTIISPGGGSRPLNQPLKKSVSDFKRSVETERVPEISPEQEMEREQPPVKTPSKRSSVRNSGLFSLPPSEAYVQDRGNSRSAGSMHEKENERIDSSDRVTTNSERSGRSRADTTFSNDSSYFTAQSHLEENRLKEETSPEHSDDHYSTQEGRKRERYEDDNGLSDNHDASFSEKQPFQRVQEYVVYNSDDDKHRIGQRRAENFSSMDNADKAESINDHHGKLDDDQDGVYDADEDYGEDSGAIEDDVSPRDDDDDLESAAEDDLPKAHMDLERIARTNIHSMAIGQSTISSGQLQHHNNDAVFEQGPSNYVHIPGPSDFITPPVTGTLHHSSQNVRNGSVNLKNVPATPPSPPNIKTLMDSISRRNSTETIERNFRDTSEEFEEQSLEGDYEDDAPVSTMEPSAELFQKLISVWQSADEKGTKPEKLMEEQQHRNYKNKKAKTDVEGVPMFVPDASMSTSGVESTIPSGNTEIERETANRMSATSRRRSGSETSRSHRPKAIRLPPNVVGSSEFTIGGSGRSREVEEGTSMASFSDAFSSDDKDREWSNVARNNSEGVEWEEAMKGDSLAGLPVSPRQEIFEAGVQSGPIGSSEGGRSLTEEEGTGTTETDTGINPFETMTSTLGDRSTGTKDVKSMTRNTAAEYYKRSGSGNDNNDDDSNSGVATDGHHVKVDRSRLDWLTKELLSARDSISRKELQMTFVKNQRMEQEEVLLLERQDAESVVGAMKKILADREHELHDARQRLSVAIQTSGPTDEGGETGGGGNSGTGTGQTTSSGTGASRGIVFGRTGITTTTTTTSGGGGVGGSGDDDGKDQQHRVSVESRSSAVGSSNSSLEQLIADGHAMLHRRFDECNAKQDEHSEVYTSEMRALWNEVQRAMFEKMAEMTERRDEELEVLRRELSNRERLIYELKESSTDLVDQNRAMQAEASELRMQKEKSAHRYELEMAHVTAKVELVDEFSKKLHDNFRETENLRQQVLQYQEKLSHIASTSGVSQRQIKELREAVTTANDDCARLRREAEMAKRKGMEAVRRAEELEELRYKDAAAHSAGKYPDRQDSGSFASHEPVRPAGHNRPGGSGVNVRYHGTRGRGIRGGGGASRPSPAQKAWAAIKDKISGIGTFKDGGSRRRIQAGGHYNGGGGSGGLGGSQSSRSQGRSRTSRDDEDLSMGGDGDGRSRSASQSSSGSDSGGGSVRSGGTRSNRSGEGSGDGSVDNGSGGGGHGHGGGGGQGGEGEGMGMGMGVGIMEGGNSMDEDYVNVQTGHQQPNGGMYGRGEVGRIRATDF